MTVETAKLNPSVAELYRKDPLTRFFYPVGKFVFSTPEKVDNFVSQNIKKNIKNKSLFGQFLVNPILKTINWMTKQFLDYDFKNFIQLGSHKLSRPSPGAFAMMLFPFTIMPRLIQAKKRASEGDSTEFYDILRRDIPTVAALLYLLDPIQEFLTKKMGQLVGVKLVDEQGKIIPASHATKNFSVDSERALIEILRDKANTPKAMQKAFHEATDQWIELAGGEVSKHIDDVKQLLPKLFEAHQAELLGKENKIAPEELKKLRTESERLSSKGFHLIKGLEDWKADKMKGYLETGKKAVDARFPSIKEFFVRYAHTRRLPVDILSFAVVVLCIGWLPVAFNDYWAQTKKARTTAASPSPTPSPEANPFNAVSTYQALKHSSRLSQGF